MKDGNFEIGDKVRFVDNELNRAEISKSARNATLEVAGYVSANRIGLRELECYYYHGRFELVPQYQVGDWVEIEYDNGCKYHCPVIQSGCSVVVMFDGAETYFDINGNELCKTENEPSFTIIRKLSPAEVVIDFGNGIKGTIRAKRKCNYSVVSFETVNGLGYTIAEIFICWLTDPMKTIVQDLLAKQEEA